MQIICGTLPTQEAGLLRFFSRRLMRSCKYFKLTALIRQSSSPIEWSLFANRMFPVITTPRISMTHSSRTAIRCCMRTTFLLYYAAAVAFPPSIYHSFRQGPFQAFMWRQTTVPYHPQSNNQAGCFVDTIKRGLEKKKYRRGKDDNVPASPESRRSSPFSDQQQIETLRMITLLHTYC